MQSLIIFFHYNLDIIFIKHIILSCTKLKGKKKKAFKLKLGAVVLSSFFLAPLNGIKIPRKHSTLSDYAEKALWEGEEKRS